MVLELQKHLKMVPSGIPDCSETTSCGTVYAIYIFYVPLLGLIVHPCVRALVSIPYNTQVSDTAQASLSQEVFGITEGEPGLFSL